MGKALHPPHGGSRRGRVGEVGPRQRTSGGQCQTAAKQRSPGELGHFPVPDRGRDGHYWAPPAQIRTCGLPAYGSHLGCLTAKRSLGQGWRTRGVGRKSAASCSILLTAPPQHWPKAAMSSSGCRSGGKRIEEEVERRDVAIAGDDEVGAGIGRGLAGPTRHPLDASGRPTEVLGFTDRRVVEIGVGRFDSADMAGFPNRCTRGGRFRSAPAGYAASRAANRVTAEGTEANAAPIAASRCSGPRARPSARTISTSSIPMKAKTARRYFS